MAQQTNNNTNKQKMVPLIFALKSRAVWLGDFYNQLQVSSHVWKAGYAVTAKA